MSASIPQTPARPPQGDSSRVSSGGPHRVVVMGVSGCGKTTVGELLAAQLDGRFLDGDVLHPESNIAKMRSGVPLEDADREPWLRQIGELLADAADDGGAW
ncbi:gluconokinase [Nesterenkonia sp. PF2B19]|uniref:gluconokinase n=1 Tax=Nesterenkonia sp. PF2B19 TaxID=1881858 RepID=UPI000A664154